MATMKEQREAEDRKRDAEWIDLRKAGWSFGQIAKQYGYTRQRVQQVLKREGVA